MSGAIEYNLGEEIFGTETKMGGLGFNEMTGGTMIPDDVQEEVAPDNQAVVDARLNTGTDAMTQAKESDDMMSDEELRADPEWQRASQNVANFYGDDVSVNSLTPATVQPTEGTATKADFDISSIEATPEADSGEYGLQLMAEMQGNIGGVSINQSRTLGGLLPLAEQAIASGDEQVLKDIVYMLDTYEEKKSMSVEGALKTTKYLFGDISNYMGIGLLATPGKIIAKKTATAGIRSQIMTKLGKISAKKKAMGVGVFEGSTYGFVESLEKQRLEVASGKKTEIDLADLAIDTTVGGVAGGVLTGVILMTPEGVRQAKKGTKAFYKWVQEQTKIQKATQTAPDGTPLFDEAGGTGAPSMMDTSPADPALVEQATKGDADSQDALAGAVFERNFERVIGKNTEADLQPMVLEKLKENPEMVEDLAKKYGFEFEYFTANPDNVGNKVGGKTVQLPPQGNRKLKKEGYEDGKIWVYDPTDTHGAFADPEYTKAWRQIHELAHGITEQYMQKKYGDSRRFGAMSFDRKNPYDSTDPRTYKGLSLAEAQRAIEWEDVAFRTQVELLKDMGIPVDAKQARDDWNVASSDTLVRALTGDFTDPGKLGVKPQGDGAEKIETKDALEFLENQEKANAEYQGREPTLGTDLDNWSPISDEELRQNIDSFRPEKVGDSVTVSVESMPGARTPGAEFKKFLEKNPEYAEEYHSEMKKIADEIFEASPLEVTHKAGDTQGAWEGSSNLVTQYDVKIPKGGTTPQFQKDLDELSMKLATDLEQDGIGWHIPSFVDTPEGEISPVLNGVQVGGGSKLTGPQMLELDSKLRETYGDTFFLASTEDGVRVIDFTGGDGYNRGTELSQAVNDIVNTFDGDYSADQFNAMSNSVEPNWKGDANGLQTNGSGGEKPSDLQGQNSGIKPNTKTKAVQQKIRTNSKVDSVLAEAEGLEGKALQKKLNSINMNHLTPANKQKVIDFRKSQSKSKPKQPKAKKEIRVNEDFNESIYSVVENEITHLESNKVYTPKELEKVFANVTNNEMTGSGIQGLIDSNPEGLTGSALQDAISARPDKIHKVQYHSGEDDIKGSTLDREDYASELVTEGDWENTPNWVESESGMGYRMTDESNGEDFYITQDWADDEYVDADGYGVGDYNDARDKWYDEHYDGENDADIISDLAVDENDDLAYDMSRGIDRRIDYLDNLIAKTGGDKPALQVERDSLEALATDLEALDVYEDGAVGGWIQKAFDEAPYAREAMKDNDVYKEAVMEFVDDDRPWEEVFDPKTYYTVRSNYETTTFDEFEDAKRGLVDEMYQDYTNRMEDSDYGEIDIHETYSINGGEDYRVGIYEMPNMNIPEGKDQYVETHWQATEQGGENVTVHTRMKDRTDNDGTVGVVSEEIQSQARQTFDETGGRGVKPTQAEVDVLTERIDRKEREMNEFIIEHNEAKEELENHRSDIKAELEDITSGLLKADEQDVIRSQKDRLEDERETVRKATMQDYHDGKILSTDTKPIMDKWDVDNNYIELTEGWEDELEALTRAGVKLMDEHPRVQEIFAETERLQEKIDIAVSNFNTTKTQKEVATKAMEGTKPSDYAEPPMEAQNYEKMVTYDNIMDALDQDAGFYGSNNGQTSNGWDVSTRGEIGGMVEAYNHRIPKIIKEITGETPYVAYYSGHQADEANRKYWVPGKEVEQSLKTKKGKPLSNYSSHFNESPLDWYWRVDLTDEVKAKLKDSKMQLYGAGGASVVGASMAQEDSKEEL